MNSLNELAAEACVLRAASVLYASVFFLSSSVTRNVSSGQKWRT